MKKIRLMLFVSLFALLANSMYGQQFALHFERNSCVDIPEISDLTGTAARTMEAWVRVPSTSESWWQPVIVEWGQNNAGEKWTFRLDNYRLRVEHGGGYAIATTTLNDDEWHHVAVTAAENSNIADVTFYIDGVKDNTSASGGGTPLINTASGPISIGRSVADDQAVRYWMGDIDEVRLWKKALTAQEINAIKDIEVSVGQNSDLVAYYKCNEGSGTTVNDETGNYNGVLASGKVDDGLPTWVSGVEFTTAVTDVLIDNEGFDVYPKPAGDWIRIISNNVELEQIVIYDGIGRQQLVFNNCFDGSLDISSLKSGLYLVKAVTAQNQDLKTIKLIKQ